MAGRRRPSCRPSASPSPPSLSPRRPSPSTTSPPPRRERLALVLGTEGDGLARRTLDAVDLTVTIPMAGGVDSLNVAAAGAVAAWALRVR